MSIKHWVSAASLLLVPALLFGEVYPQAGLETYMGPNGYLSFSPWAAVRVSTSPNSSVIFKVYRHLLNFDYVTDEGTTVTQDAQLSNFTLVYYYQKGKLDFYAAGSYLTGPVRGLSYYGAALDSGVEYKLWKFLAVTAGVYLLNENSVLWFPDQAQRNVLAYSLKSGLKIKLLAQLVFNPNVYILKNSDGVTALSYSAGLVYMPQDSVYITVYYWRYGERSDYKFAGNYLSAGLNFYF